MRRAPQSSLAAPKEKLEMLTSVVPRERVYTVYKRDPFFPQTKIQSTDIIHVNTATFPA